MFYSSLKSVILILSITFPVLLFSQSYTISNWSVEDGLSSNDVRDIFQDKAGFMWIATEHGLNKFDGYSFEKFRYHPADSTSMGANFINQIVEDSLENIWVSLGVGLLSEYNRKTKKFTTYTFAESNTYIMDIDWLPGIGMAIATNNGFFQINNDSKKLMPFDFPQKGVYKIFPTPNHRTYLSTQSGFEVYNHRTRSLDPLHYIHNQDTVLFNASVSRFFESEEGSIWIQTPNGTLCHAPDGVYFRLAKSGAGHHVDKPTGQAFIAQHPDRPSWFLSNDAELLEYDKASNEWQHFSKQIDQAAFSFTDNEQQFWVFSKNNDLFKWNGERWDHILKLEGKINYYEIINIYIDKENGIWFSTKGKGVWRIFNRKWPINSFVNQLDQDNPELSVTSTLAEDDFIWLGSFNQLFQYFNQEKKLVPFFPESNSENPLSRLIVNDLSQGPNNKLWIATNNGLVVTEKEDKAFEFINRIKIDEEGVSLGNIRFIEKSPNGTMFLGSSNGLFIYDSVLKEFFHFHYKENQKTEIRNNAFHCMLVLNDTSFLLGYIKEGVDLVSYNPKSHSIQIQKLNYKGKIGGNINLMSANTFYKEGENIWLGTFSKGLLALDIDSLSLRPLSPSFPIIPNIKSIQKGLGDNLWISSIDGIRRVNTKDKTYYRFTKSSGLLSNQFYLNSSTTGSSNCLYFGSSAGLNIITPGDWVNMDTVSTPILTAFKKFDQESTFSIPLNEVTEIQVNYTDDFITFEFVSPTYDNPADVQYAYQLAGFDPDWRYSDVQRSATYTNLPPGDYLFRIKAGNKGGFLNSEIKEVRLLVANPFWQSSWFVFLVTGILIISFWTVHAFRKRMRLNRLKIATEIREKAAADFHDELGHRLTKINLFADALTLQKDQFPKKSLHLLQKIKSNANELYYSTRDFIWAMNPSKDSALDLFILLRDFGDELFEDTPIQFSVEGLKEEYKDYILDMDWKRQLVMIFKEAMNNALKHSNSTAVILKIQECKKRIRITLEDNGSGFILDHEKFGYGLGSMVTRSKKIGGQLEIHSLPGQGTEVLFKL